MTPNTSEVTATGLAPSLALLMQKLSSEVQGGKIHLSLERRGLIVSLETGSFFRSGGSEIPLQAYPTIGKVAEVLNTLPNSIRLEGHTDSRPISNVNYRSNWELSASRSIAILRLLSMRFKVDARRMSIAGLADNQPLSPNDSEKGWDADRRVDIVVALAPTDGLVSRAKLLVSKISASK